MSIIRRCVDEKLEVNYYDYYSSFSALMGVLLKGEEELALQMIELGADIHHCDDYDCLSVAECAARSGCVNVIRLCIREDAIYYPDHTLFKSIKYPEIVKMLLNQGADPLFMNHKGDTVLMNASKHGVTESVKLLLEAGANLHDKDKIGKTALLFAPNMATAQYLQTMLDLQDSGY